MERQSPVQVVSVCGLFVFKLVNQRTWWAHLPLIAIVKAVRQGKKQLINMYTCYIMWWTTALPVQLYHYDHDVTN